MRTVPRTLQFRAAILIAGAFVLFLSLFFVTTYFSIRASLIARSDGEVREQLLDIRSKMSPDISRDSLGRMLRDHREIGESPLQFIVLQKTSVGFIPIVAAPIPQDDVATLELHPNDVMTFSTTEGDMRMIGMIAANFTVGAVYNTSVLEEAEESIVDVFTYSLVAGIIVAIIGSIALSRYLIGPIGTLARSARHISEQPERGLTRLPISSRIAEIAELARSINALLEARERALEQQKNFAADAAHELRTPLTVLKGEIEVELRLAPDRPQAELLRSNLEEIERLISTVQDLLELAEIGSEPVRDANREMCSLLSAIKNASARLLSLAAERGISIRIPEQDVKIRAQERRMVRLIYNLLLNAMQHSRPGSEIEIRIVPQRDTYVLEIEDHGEGMLPERIEHLFERFYRAGNDEHRGGAGLGLAIVKTIADHYGFSLSINSSTGSGTTISVLIPIAPLLG